MHAQLEDLYSLKLPLGRNLAGAVWKAETLKGGKPAAVAVLDLEDLSDPELRKRTATRFRRDMGLLKRVNHPHVVRVFDVGRTREGRPFAAMEHVDGDSLRDWLEEEHSGADRIRVASALLDGLQAAHRAGVAHGDLEPGNILMTRDGMPKLIGFGLNRTLARQSHPEWRETSGLAKSIAFRAPEEAQGMGGLSADLFATGVLLHLICSDELPSEEGSTLRENAPKLPAGLIAVIERALVKDPAERHPNVGAMRRAWLAAAKVGRDAVVAATTGFRSEAKGRTTKLSSPPAVGVALSVEEPDHLDDELDEEDVGRPSLMPVGVALADDGEDGEDEDQNDDLTSIPPDQVNVMSSRPPPVGTREISERFSDPPADPGMRISLSDALMADDPPPDPEMRLSLSDVMEEVTPAEAPKKVLPASPREAPRRPEPSAPLHAQPVRDEPSKGRPWLGLVAALVIGGVAWFALRSPEPAGSEPTASDASGATAAELEEPVATDTVETVETVEPVETAETPIESEEVVVVALRLHGLPPESQVTVDGEAVELDGDSIPFPGDGAEHAILVQAEGFEDWERSLATATTLDLLVVAEPLVAEAPASMREPGVNSGTASMSTASMSTAPRQTTSMSTTMRPGLARDPGF